MVEHDLAKVEVEGSRPFSRSRKVMTADEILDAIDRHQIRLVRRVGSTGVGWEIVAYSDRASGVGPSAREAITECVRNIQNESNTRTN